MRRTRRATLGLLTVAVAVALVMARVGSAQATSSCTMQNGALQVQSAGVAGVAPEVFCSDGVSWRVSVSPQYLTGNIWHDFSTVQSGNDATKQLPNEACVPKSGYSNASRHDLTVDWALVLSCSGGVGTSDNAFVHQTLSPNACNQTTLRTEYTFRNAANGDILRVVDSGNSQPGC